MKNLNKIITYVQESQEVDLKLKCLSHLLKAKVI